MLERILEELRYKLNNSHLSGLNERNTDRVFVSPLLENLGYDLANLDETVAGYHLKDVAGGSDIAYAFYSHRRMVMLLEIRPLYSDLSALKNLSRVFAIAHASQTPLLVLTNGVEWHIYACDEAAAEPQPVERIDIRSDEAEEKFRHLDFKRLASGEITFTGQSLNSGDGVTGSSSASSSGAAFGTDSRGAVKNRGYKISEDTHTRLNRLRTRIMTQREVRDQEITNSMIVECVLRMFLDTAEAFDHREISNQTILNKRIEEALSQRFSS